MAIQRMFQKYTCAGWVMIMISFYVKKDQTFPILFMVLVSSTRACLFLRFTTSNMLLNYIVNN